MYFVQFIKMVYQHGSSEIKRVFKYLKRKGFAIEERKNGYKIVPPNCIGGDFYFTHGTESAYHSLRRDFARMYSVDVTSDTDLQTDPVYTTRTVKI